MKLPPAWKIRRELLALVDQIKALLLILFAPIRKVIYEKRELRDIRLCEGERVLNKNLILYLIYRPGSLLDSHYAAINSFISQGSEVLLISNGKLSLIDIEKLKKITWRIIERENVGYDFGGYRCGLNYLKSKDIYFDSIHLINDSIWYPILGESRIFHHLRDVVDDFGGAVCLPDGKFNNSGLILSFWLTINRALFDSEIFWDFWRKYIPSGNKTLTVKLGERGISRHMNKEGRVVAGLFTLNEFKNAIESADFEQLKLTLRYASFTDLNFQEECEDLLLAFAQNESWRNTSINFINKVVSKRNFLHSFCYPSIAIMGVPFLKKNNLKLQIEMRKKYVAAVKNGDLPMPEADIFAEIVESIDVADQPMAFR